MDSDLPPVLFPEVNEIERARLFAHIDRIVEKWSDSLERLPEGTDTVEGDAASQQWQGSHALRKVTK